MRGLFSYDGPVMKVMTDIMDLVILNFLTILCCIPVVTSGAALASLHYVLMQIREDRGGSRVKTYFHQFKGNVKAGIPVSLFFVLAAVVLFIDYQIYVSTEGSQRWVLIPVFVGIILFGALFVWVFPLMARFENRFKATMKNALILAVGYAPRTFGMIAITVGVVFLFTQVTSLFPLLAFLGVSLPAYLSMFLYFPVIDKMVKEVQAKAGDGERDGSGEGFDWEGTGSSAENEAVLPPAGADGGKRPSVDA